LADSVNRWYLSPEQHGRVLYQAIGEQPPTAFVLLSPHILCTSRRFHAAKRMLAALIQKLTAES
jgi:hypothetical protein